ncbi:uncharacterized protein SETTUDRAFT_178730 [Exserohilum turcica Et28A]|uniref:Uncharacterized protein n=1 Tax=Exserohilum turcicum (strain 28A) TaxID=671987 RepID=R0K0T6_EXST2|nr:uncharacterized protein SETTUDRAFT_178730 [Exserohilum turcica Et28A]EOA86728.1 hypothetical protein SETTUDRAFT_178730 [Exserohilum turcica Et28A]
MDFIHSLRLSSGRWSPCTVRLDNYLSDQSHAGTEYLLMQEDPFSSNAGEPLSPEIIQYFQIPRYLLADVYRRSNGFFAFKELPSADGRPASFYMWFRLLAKVAYVNDGMHYKWHEMTFCYRWDYKSIVVLCIGVDASFQNHLYQNLGHMWSEIQGSQPGSLLVPLIEVLVMIYDQSVWSIRDVIRHAEMDRTRSTRDATHFTLLHEAARHASHSSETLSVAIETLGSIQQQTTNETKRASAKLRGVQESFESVNRQLDLQLRMLQNLSLRAQSNKERLQSEIALAYNMIAQRDSQIMTGLGEAARYDSQIMKQLGAAAREDSGAMRTIAVVTMFFLPPTFLSAIFSMSFFNYTPPEDGRAGRWSISEKFWIYWAIAIPLTALTLGIWVLRQRWLCRR